jgi:ribosome recycling factor
MSDELIKLVFDDTDDKMRKAVEHARAEFSGVRTGRAAPALVEKILVDYSGSELPLQQIAGFQVPEARMLVISPYDKGSLGAIEKAIQQSDLGLNPSNDGQLIRLMFPQLNADRRKELVRVVKAMAEDGRIALRNLRRAARHELDALVKDNEANEDDVARAEKDLDKLTRSHEAEIDKALDQKEQELLEI